MLRVRIIIRIRHAPLIRHKPSSCKIRKNKKKHVRYAHCNGSVFAGVTWLENTLDFLVAGDGVGGVARGLDGVHGIKRVVCKGQLHEIALDAPTHLLHPQTLGELVAADHLKADE